MMIAFFKLTFLVQLQAALAFPHLAKGGRSVADALVNELADAAADFNNGVAREGLPQAAIRFTESIAGSEAKFKRRCRFAGMFESGSQGFPISDQLRMMIDGERTSNKTLPDLDEIFTNLMQREPSDDNYPKNEGERAINFLAVSFLNFFMEDFMRTNHKEGRPNTWLAPERHLLNSIYGREESRSKLLRLGSSGKLRTSINRQGDEVALMWKDVDPQEFERPADLTFEQ